MKRTLSLLLSFVMIISILSTTGFTAYADDFSNAQTIGVNQTVSGNTLKGNNYEQDIYKIYITADGALTVRFNNPLQASSDSYWKVVLYNSDYTELCSADIKGNLTQTVLPTIGVTSNYYYVKIQSSVWYETAKSTDVYQLTAEFSASSYWEKEYNEDYISATPIALNTTYYGTTRKGYDYEKDYYKMVMPSNGCLTVTFSNPLQAASETYWNITLYDSEYKELCTAECKGNVTQTVLTSVGVKANDYYYVKVQSSVWYEGAKSTDTYSINAGFSPSEYWEKEFNDSYTTANSINSNTTYYGTIRSGYDYEKDYYTFNISSSDVYSININTPNLQNSDTYWNVYLYDSSYEELTKLDIKGNITYTNSVAVLSPGTYYICVQSSNWSGAKSTEAYSVSVTNYTETSDTSSSSGGTATVVSKPKKPSINKLTKGKKKITVQWKKVKGVKGYQVQAATNSKFTKNKKTVTVKKQKTTKTTLKKLKSKKKYYVRVRTYKVVNGKKVYSKWSKVKTVKTK